MFHQFHNRWNLWNLCWMSATISKQDFSGFQNEHTIEFVSLRRSPQAPATRSEVKVHECWTRKRSRPRRKRWHLSGLNWRLLVPRGKRAARWVLSLFCQLPCCCLSLLCSPLMLTCSHHQSDDIDEDESEQEDSSVHSSSVPSDSSGRIKKNKRGRPAKKKKKGEFCMFASLRYC